MDSSHLTAEHGSGQPRADDEESSSFAARLPSGSESDDDDESVVIDIADMDSDKDTDDVQVPQCDDHPATTSAVMSMMSKALANDVSKATAAALLATNGGDVEPLAVDRSATACCICGEPAAYRCPGCERRTCSMTCVRAHKADFACTGERDVAQKVPLAKFTSHQLERDFHFLEQCRKAVANAERSFPHMWRYSFKALPPPLYALRAAAKKRGVLCQITSEGMQKRDSNTSRYDRKADTIVWHCEFRFHRRVPPLQAEDPANAEASALPAPDFTVLTDWASERHRLGDMAAYCWATNPPLPCYQINRRYNRAPRRPREDEAAEAAPPEDGVTATREVSDENAAEAVDWAECEPLSSELPAASPESESVPVTTAVTQTDEGSSAPHDVAELDGDATTTPPALEAETEKGEGTPDQEPTTAVPAAVIPDGIVPLTPDEVRNEFLVRQFLAAKDAVFLCRAERLGTTTKYFRLDPAETLNECLRVLFFVNEYPIVDVIHASDLDSVLLVTDADREAIRASFKPREKPTPSGHGVPRKRSDLTEDEIRTLARVPCRMHLSGQCRQGEECPYWHCTFDEVPACRSFVRDGQCPKGDRCSFRHDDAAVRDARKRRRVDDSGPPRRPPSAGRGGGAFGRGRGRGRGGGRGQGRFQR